jgi:1-deoxy-D-xylulose-5-phosphate synthase
MPPLLDGVDSPEDLRKIPAKDLPALCAEIRALILDTVLQTGGHLATNLGSVELTAALHYVFDFPRDRLVMDVGHQAYAHKILTGRKSRFATLRQEGGLSGFTNNQESPYDLYTTGHAGTALSTALGIACGEELRKSGRRTVAVIGDAGIGAGMALEALNMAGEVKRDLLVVLNDNRMSIAPSNGAMVHYFTRLRTNPSYRRAKHDVAEAVQALFGDKARETAEHWYHTLRYAVVPGHLFEELGFHYFGPVDGHDVEALVRELSDLKDVKGPRLLHVMTEKGHGYKPALDDPVKFHGVKPNPQKKAASKPAPAPDAKTPPALPPQPSWTKAFADALIDLASEDPRVVAITAAMPDGTGLNHFAEKFPDRFFDVGICEQHAVGLSSGLATAGLVPVAAIYSTFLQRGYDQVFHEVTLQGRKVVFALDRAGVVGSDGVSHTGAFDIAYLRTLPGIALMAPKDAPELREMLRFAVAAPGIFALRYPRDEVPPAIRGGKTKEIELGKAEVLLEGPDGGIVAYGASVYPAWCAAKALEHEGIRVTVVNGRFAKPVDADLLVRLHRVLPFLVTVEDHAALGGFGSAVLEALAAAGEAPRVRVLGLPDQYLEHAERDRLMARFGLDADGIAATVRSMVGALRETPADAARPRPR